MVHEDAESSDTASSPRRRVSSSSSTMSATQEDVLMDLETNRFEFKRSVPQRRVSCISSFGRKPIEDMLPMRREGLGGRRLSMDLSRPVLSKATRRDRDMNKMFFEIDVGARKITDGTRNFMHDVEVVQSLNLTVSKRIDNLLYGAAEMRDSHRHIFKQQESEFKPTKPRRGRK